MNDDEKNIEAIHDYEHVIQNNKAMRSKIQTFMNDTRDKLNQGKFNPNNFKLVNLTIKNSRIPREFDNYEIIHITDIHLGQWINKEKLDGVVKIINNQQPDSVMITGDFLSYQTSNYLHELSDSLSNIKSCDGTFSVLGNHDHWTNAGDVKKALKKAGIVNLENDVYAIEKNNQKLQIAGVDSITVDMDDIGKVQRKLDYNYPAIMLAHEPDFADTTAKYDPFILQLSGHSHGGQIEIPKIGTPVRGKNFMKYPLGEYKVGNMIQYTNRGIGTNAFWFKINSFNEITKIKLTCT